MKPLRRCLEGLGIRLVTVKRRPDFTQCESPERSNLPHGMAVDPRKRRDYGRRPRRRRSNGVSRINIVSPCRVQRTIGILVEFTAMLCHSWHPGGSTVLVFPVRFEDITRHSLLWLFVMPSLRPEQAKLKSRISAHRTTLKESAAELCQPPVNGPGMKPSG